MVAVLVPTRKRYPASLDLGELLQETHHLDVRVATRRQDAPVDQTRGVPVLSATEDAAGHAQPQQTEHACAHALVRDIRDRPKVENIRYGQQLDVTLCGDGSIFDREIIQGRHE